jgi:hypothetical protein
MRTIHAALSSISNHQNLERKGTEMTSLRLLSCTAALLILATAMSGRAFGEDQRASTSYASPLPAALTGTWQRTVKAPDVHRVSGTAITAGSTFKLVISRDGTIRLTSPRYDAPGDGRMTVSPGHHVHLFIGFSQDGKDTYTWKTGSSRLTFRLISDSDPNNQVIFVGTWTRR